MRCLQLKTQARGAIDNRACENSSPRKDSQTCPVAMDDSELMKQRDLSDEEEDRMFESSMKLGLRLAQEWRELNGGQNSPSTAPAGYIDWMFQRHEELAGAVRAADYPWRFFVLPSGGLLFLQNASKSAMLRLNVISRSRMVAASPQLEKPIHTAHCTYGGGSAYQSRKWPETSSAAAHSCRHCGQVVFDMRDAIEADRYGSGRVRQLPLHLQHAMEAARDGCLLFERVVSALRKMPNRPHDEIDTFYHAKFPALELGHKSIPSLAFSAQSIEHSRQKNSARMSKVDLAKMRAIVPSPEETSEESASKWYQLSADFDIFAEDDCGSYHLDNISPPDLNPDSPAAYSHVRQCIADCKKSHTKCQAGSSSYVPKRLLVVDEHDGILRIRLCTSSQEVPYSTLSYVWGNSQPSRLVQANRATYEQGITDDDISAVVPDAAKVKLEIGLRHLWVDAYCIIQDDDHEKEEQLAQMHDVYRGATVTIAGIASQTSTEGFLQPRKAFQPVRLNVRWDDSVWGTMLAVTLTWRTSTSCSDVAGHSKRHIWRLA